jgi:hypothetical protein
MSQKAIAICIVIISILHLTFSYNNHSMFVESLMMGPMQVHMWGRTCQPTDPRVNLVATTRRKALPLHNVQPVKYMHCASCCTLLFQEVHIQHTHSCCLDV